MPTWLNDNGTSTEVDGIQHGEILKCIVLDQTFPSAYLKELAEKQQGLDKEAAALGIPAEQLIPSHKEGGIELKIGILMRQRSEDMPFESVIEKGVTVEEPAYVCYSSVRAYPPSLVYEGKGKSYYMPSTVLGLENAGGHPKIIMLPSVFSAKDWGSGYSYDQFADEETGAELRKKHRESWIKVRAYETSRVLQWKRQINAFNALDEPGAVNDLLTLIAAQIGSMCYNEETNMYEYILPSKGTRFEIKAVRKEGSKYLNLSKYERVDKEWRVYGKIDVMAPELDDIELANSIIELREKNKTERASEYTEYQFADDDEVPF